MSQWVPGGQEMGQVSHGSWVTGQCWAGHDGLWVSLRVTNVSCGPFQQWMLRIELISWIILSTANTRVRLVIDPGSTTVTDCRIRQSLHYITGPELCCPVVVWDHVFETLMNHALAASPDVHRVQTRRAGVRGSQPAYVTDVIQPAIHHITLWSATNNHSAVPCRPTRLNVLSVQPLLVCGTVSRQTFTTQLHCSSPPEGNSTLLWAFHKPTTALWHRFVTFRTNCCFNIVSNRSVLHCCKRHYQIHVWAIAITQIYSLEVGRLLSLIHLTALVVSRSVKWPITWPIKIISSCRLWWNERNGDDERITAGHGTQHSAATGHFRCFSVSSRTSVQRQKFSNQYNRNLSKNNRSSLVHFLSPNYFASNEFSRRKLPYFHVI